MFSIAHADTKKTGLSAQRDALVTIVVSYHHHIVPRLHIEIISRQTLQTIRKIAEYGIIH